MMKRFLSITVCIMLMFGILCIPALAAGLDPKLLSAPHDLTVTQMVTDEGHPFGGVDFHYKIDSVPLGYEDDEGSYYYQLDFEQKIGANGVWESIGGPLADELVEGFYMEAPGKYKYSDTWMQDYSGTIVSYRVRMTIDDTDAFTAPIASTPWSNVVTIGVEEYANDFERLSGASRIDTAIAVSKEGWPNGADTVILTRDDNYPDALTGAPLSKKLDAPILFTNSQTLTTETEAEIARLKAGKVIILGGTGAVSQGIEDKLKLIYEVKRIGGIDRYETAAKIAKELGYKGKAVITTGEDFHDALLVSPLAAYNRIPILLTLPDELPSFTKDALEFVAPTEITIVGNLSSVSENAAASLTNAKRIRGNDIFEAAVVVAKHFGADPGMVFLATGKDFPDALSGSALAAKYNSPILFVNEPLSIYIKQYLMEKKAETTKINLLGGEGVISQATKDAINQIYE